MELGENALFSVHWFAMFLSICLAWYLEFWLVCLIMMLHRLHIWVFNGCILSTIGQKRGYMNKT